MHSWFLSLRMPSARWPVEGAWPRAQPPAAYGLLTLISQQQAPLSKLFSGTRNCFPGSLAHQPPVGPATGWRAVLGGDWKWSEGNDFLFQRPSAAASWLQPLQHWQRQRPCPVSQRKHSCTMFHSTTPGLCLPGKSRLPPGPSVSEVRAQTQDTQSAKPQGSGNIISLVPSGRCLLPTLNFWGILGPPFAHSSSSHPSSQHPVLNPHCLKLGRMCFPNWTLNHTVFSPRPYFASVKARTITMDPLSTAYFRVGI